MLPTIETDYAIVGTGPAGATIAKELTRQGKGVLLLEKGKRDPITASKFNAYKMYDKWAVFSRSKEGVIVDRAITLGGCSVVFSGNSFDPPPWLEEEMGIDLSDEARAIKTELGIRPFSEAFTSPWDMTRRMRESAADLGINLKPQAKFIDEAMCRNVCDGCMTGCRNGAKWTARRWVDDAVEDGAKLITEADVDRVIIEGGRAVGLEARTPEGEVSVRANHVILSAGGIGTAVVLQRSGVKEAGRHFFMDPMNVLWGMTDAPCSPTTEMTFSHACEDTADTRGFILGNVSGKGAWVSLLMRPLTGWRVLSHYGNWNRMSGMFIKVADDTDGRIFPDGRMSKPLSQADRKKAHEATELARQIMIRSGIRPESIRVAENIGGHPGGTAAVGRVIDKQFQVMSVKDLFVCDASVFPRSPGRPPTLALLALARRFARDILPTV